MKSHFGLRYVIDSLEIHKIVAKPYNEILSRTDPL